MDKFPRAKAAKILKNLIDYVSKIEGTLLLESELCRMLIDWCVKEKRTYLKHKIEIRLADLLVKQDQFQ